MLCMSYHFGGFQRSVPKKMTILNGVLYPRQINIEKEVTICFHTVNGSRKARYLQANHLAIFSPVVTPSFSARLGFLNEAWQFREAHHISPFCAKGWWRRTHACSPVPRKSCTKDFNYSPVISADFWRCIVRRNTI